MADGVHGMAAMILELLAQTLTNEPSIRSQAEQKLEDIQNNGTSFELLVSLLQRVSAGGPMDPNVRLMAAIWLKNIFKKKWRSNQFTNEQKQQLRQLFLVATVQEPLALVAAHLNLIVAQIARSDFPAAWSFEQLFTPLLAALRGENQLNNDEAANLRQIRSVGVLLLVVKELSARRLLMHRKQFASMSLESLPVLLPFWHDLMLKTTRFMANELPNQLQQSVQVTSWLANQCQLLLGLSKTISTMLLHAFRELMMAHDQMQHQEQEQLVHVTFRKIYEHLDALLACRSALSTFLAQTSSSCNQVDHDKVLECYDKITIRLAKIVVETQKSYAIEFRGFLKPFAEFFWKVLHNNKSLEASQTKLLIQSIGFFNNVVSCRLYKVENLGNPSDGAVVSKVITSTGEVQVDRTMVLEAQETIQAFLDTTDPTVSVLGDASTATATRLQNLVHLTITQLLCMTQEEREDWEHHPEDYFVSSEHATSQESVRVSAENLFLSVLQSFPQPVIPILMNSLSMASQWLQLVGSRPADVANRQHELVVVDAILLALGLSCYDLHEAFEFEPWFLSTLVPFLVQQQQNLKALTPETKILVLILLNRTVWLVTCWLAQLSGNIRVPLYEALLNEAFFGRGNGEVDDGDMHLAILQLRVVQTMTSMLNDWGFEQDKFVPFANRLIECCYLVFTKFEELEGKSLCLNCVETLIDVMGEQMMPLVPLVCEPLPSIWNQSSDSLNMIRSRILSLLTALLHAIQQDEEQAQSTEVTAHRTQLISMCLQIVAFATSSDNPSQVFLMENGLELWKKSLESMGSNGDYEYTQQIHLLFENAVVLMNRDYEHVQIVMELVENYLRLGQMTFWSHYHQQVGSMLESILGNTKAEATIQLAGTTERIIVLLSQHQQATDTLLLASLMPLLSKMLASCRTFADKAMDRDPESVVLGFLHVFARMIVHQMAFFAQCVAGMGGVQSLVVLIDLMVQKYFGALRVAGVDSLRKRLWALALVTLLSVGEGVVVDRIGPVLDICGDVIQEEEFEQLKAGKTTGQESDQGVATSDEEEEEKGSLGRLRAYQKLQQQEVRRKRRDPVFQVAFTPFVCAKLNELSTRIGPDHFQELLRENVDQSIVQKLQQLASSST